MGSIGAPELIVLALIGVVLLGGLVGAIVLVRVITGPKGLVPCPACRRRVSARATACPHCGDPLAR